jgi:hypothetical protein
VRRLFSAFLLLSILSGAGACHKPKPSEIKTTPKAQGSLVILGAPEGALLIIDEGETFPLSPRSRLTLSTGQHRVTVECDGFFSMYQLVTIKEKEEISVTVLLQPYMPD